MYGYVLVKEYFGGLSGVSVYHSFCLQFDTQIIF
jgi:hypothetical protein